MNATAEAGKSVFDCMDPKEFVWWAGSVFSILLAVKQVHEMVTAKKKAKSFVKERAGRGGRLELVASSHGLKWDKKRGVVIVPGYGTIPALGDHGLKASQRDDLGFDLVDITASQDIMPQFAVIREWPL